MPERPLYQEADIAKLPDGGNVGLWYDKFCNQWSGTILDPASQDRTPQFDKQKWIATVTKQPCGDREELQQFVQRQLKLVKGLDGQWLLMRTTSSFVTGLGREHPVENGFLWHPTLGVPYLPGSSVKGMVGAWIKYWRGEKERRQSILGSQQQVGQVAFLDALPLKPVGLKADVMTPHYTDYYQKGKPPGDWISPVPIPFLVVEENTTFHFAIVPRRQSDEAREHCETVLGWLEKALEWIGIGAKTSVGYGRFLQNMDETEKLRSQELAEQEVREQEKRLAALPPVVRDIEEVLEGRQNKNMPEHTAVLIEIKNNRWEGNDKVEAAKWVRDKMREIKKWKETSQAKRPEKDKDYQLTQLVMSWLDDT